MPDPILLQDTEVIQDEKSPAKKGTIGIYSHQNVLILQGKCS